MIRTRSLPSIIIFFLFIVALGGIVWGTFQLVESNPFGIGFSIQYLSIRSLVMDDISPYSNENAQIIKNTDAEPYYYNRGGEPKYISPLFSGVVIFPFSLIGNETLAHGLWSTIQFLAIFMITYLGLRITGWKTSWYSFFFFLIFSLFSYHIVIPWIDGGLAIWSALFLIIAISFIQNDQIEASGVFLGLALIQPIMVILPIIFIVIWSISQGKKLLIVWFFLTIVLFSIIGLFFVSDWFIQYLRLLYNFSNNFPAGNLALLFSGIWPGFGHQFGWIFSGICIVLVLTEWWLAVKKGFRWFLWTVCFTIVISQWIGIPTVPENLFGMIFALIFVSALFVERWSRGGQWVGVFISIVLFVWEWALFYNNTFSLNPGMQNNLIIPLPFVLLIGLYWVRWWAVKPRGLLLDELRFSEKT